MKRLVGLLLLALGPVGAAHATDPGVRGVAVDGTLDAIASAPSVEERFAEIHRRVQAVVVYPPIARAREVTGQTRIEFAIDREGQPAELRILASSGSALLDAAAAQAVRDAAPLPWIHGRVIVPVRFNLGEPH